MSLRVTIDVFSGRDNPVIELSEEEARNYLQRLTPQKKLSKADAAFAESTVMGYRGMIVEQTTPISDALPTSFKLAADRLVGPQLSHKAVPSDVEGNIIQSHATEINDKYGAGFSDRLLNAVEERRKGAAFKSIVPIPYPPRKICKPSGCPFRSPVPDLAWWNDGLTKQQKNNCYNYSTNYRTDTFAQPGRGSGTMYSSITAAQIREAAVRDTLIDAPTADNKYPPEGQLVALVIWPGSDFHWYRKGQNGYWTHKPGGTQATNLDNSGKVITDPRTANRGPYTEFATFMIVHNGHIILK